MADDDDDDNDDVDYFVIAELPVAAQAEAADDRPVAYLGRGRGNPSAGAKARDHRYICARMRERKALKGVDKLSSNVVDILHRAADAVQSHGVVRKGAVIHVMRLRRRAGVPELKLCVPGTSVGEKVAINARALVQLWYDGVTCCADLARVYKVSKKSVRRMQCLGAHITMQAQEKKLSQIAEVIERSRPLFFISSLAHDETSENLVLPLAAVPVEMRDSCRSSWHVLVSRQSFLVGVHSPDGDIAAGVLKTLRPVVPLLSTADPAFQHGLFDVACAKPIADFETRGFEVAQIAVAHHDMDGAFGNELMFLLRMSKLPPKVLGSSMHCSNHRNQLIEAAVQDIIGLGILSSMYSASLFFRMGGHWLRLLRAIPAVVADLAIEYGNAPQSHLRVEVTRYAEPRGSNNTPCSCYWVSCSFGCV
jgi:hypothetical protein